jgi:signal transduction histidine kinase/CheY-like chemotaxis protein
MNWLSLSDAKYEHVSAAQERQIMTPIYLRGDRIIAAFIALHTILALVLAFKHNTWAATLALTPLIAGLFGLTYQLAQGTYFMRVTAGVCLQGFVGLHVYQLDGAGPAHYLFFVAYAAMLVYQDGRCLWVSALIAMGAQTGIVILQHFGAPLVYLDVTSLGSLVVAMHLVVSAGHVAMCFWWSELLRRNTIANSIRQEEIERSREQLRHAKLASDQANQVKSDFLASMSHEIRTPMTAILGYADLLNDEETGRSPQARSEIIKTIQRNGEHLLELINDILDISKIEAGRMTVEHIELRPVELLEEVASLMRVRASAKRIDLNLNIAWPIPSSIKSDPVRLKQIIVNLLSNAIKFTDHGSVTISAQFLQKPRPSMRIDVTDTGIGMDAAQLARLFQAFSQAEQSTTRKYGGTGLGLNISKKLAILLGGDVTVSSESGKGSTFSLTIATGPLINVPMQTEPGLAPTAVASQKSFDTTLPLKGLRVLLAEDGPDNQRLITFHLTRAGAQVDVAPNGLIAVERAQASKQSNKPYAVILMDMEMPVMNGFTAAKSLRDSRYDRPIIALTAHAMAGDRERCMAAGCDDYLTKPINKVRLIEVCQAAGQSLATAADELKSVQTTGLPSAA